MRIKKYQIEPVEIKFHGIMTQISVSIGEYQIGSPDMPTLIVSFYNEAEAKGFEVKAMMLDDAYASWGTDDSLVINYVCNILGLTRV